MSSMNTSGWVKFFQNAGLPHQVATKYAIIFTDHRIQIDMLVDLTKEILYDMGIKTMGDVIAILRHAKNVHDDKTKEKMLGACLSGENVGSGKKSVSTPVPIMHRNLASKQTISNSLASRLGGVLEQRKLSPPVKSPLTNVISLKRSLPDDERDGHEHHHVMPAKLRRLFSSESDDETMPSHLMTQQVSMRRVNMNVSPLDHSLLSRLGKSIQASSSSRTLIPSPSSISTSSSVFARLGGNKSDTETANRITTLTTGRSLRQESISKPSTVRSTQSVMQKIVVGSPSIQRTQMTSPMITRTRIAGVTQRTVENTGYSSVIHSNKTPLVGQGVKQRLGLGKTSSGASGMSRVVPSKNTLIVKRMADSSTSISTQNRSIATSLAAQSKRLAIKRAVDAKKTISLKKNVFDRLGNIKL